MLLKNHFFQKTRKIKSEFSDKFSNNKNTIKQYAIACALLYHFL